MESHLGPRRFLLGLGKTTLAQHLGYRILTEKNDWSFVFYWAAASGGYSNPAQRLHQVFESLSEPFFGRAKALAIIDNVHFDTKLFLHLLTEKKNWFGDGIHVPFIARCTNASVRADEEDWRRRPSRERCTDEIVFFLLEETAFEETAKGIVTKYCQRQSHDMPWSSGDECLDWLQELKSNVETA